MPRMTGDEARERFAQARSATLATADAEGRPHLVPVTFAMTGDVVVFAVDHKPKDSHRLKRLANIRSNPALSLLVDSYDEDWERLWWARADGSGRVLPPAGGSPASSAYADLLTQRYMRQYGPRPPEGPVVEIAVERWTGWRAA
ncbi:TIGR03668 family PPOX class F420-dependent oxidoreductase [Streptomyces bathyalis]|uniref:TIGR03668 family PPOX class F420-dependent oxidoreductase n=1 Tax=Streptomyces bathyalis TaxID=2710756 RepID=A0A7T1WS97_9ACTN|nr:TIGR03668 family PPOX class F420-dependent oxidoreductase [Streptomyces bathyalis]QPP05500.1 TIGR03668 family PPOX class F420-dependent oxidoreductase [Streptomyces bathyalis]